MPFETVKWRKGQKDAFERWFHQELENTKGDRGPLVTKWTDALVQWRARHGVEERDWPWPGASAVEIPLTAMHTDPVYADEMTTFHASPDFFHVQALRGDRVEHANALRELMTRLDRDFLKMREVNASVFLDQIVLGTGIYKTDWIDRTKSVRDYNEVGEIDTILQRMSFPRTRRVPLFDFFWPANGWHLDPDAPVGGMEWKGERFFLTESQLRARSQGDPSIKPVYDKQATEFVITQMKENLATEEPVRQKIMSEDEYQPWRDRKIELFEIWARFDVDDDGIDEDVVVIWHQESSTILRAMHNPFLHGKGPYDAIRYLQGFGFLGIGMAEADEWSQDTMSKLMRAQLDNILLANTIMLSAPEGSDIMPGEPLYPGRIFLRPPGAGNRVEPIRMGDIYASLPNVIGQVMQLSEQRTTVSELRQGDISQLPSRTPASSLISILNEGNKKFDEIMGTMRGPLGQIGLKTIQNLSQWMREDPAQWEQYFRGTLGEQDAMLVLEALSVPVTSLGDTFGVEVKAVSSLSNKETEKQNMIGLMQIGQQVGQSAIQLAQLAEQTAGTVTSQVAAQMYSSLAELWIRILERFDVQNTEVYALPPRIPFETPDQMAAGQIGAPPQTGLPAGRETGLAPELLGRIAGIL